MNSIGFAISRNANDVLSSEIPFIDSCGSNPDLAIFSTDRDISSRSRGHVLGISPFQSRHNLVGWMSGGGAHSILNNTIRLQEMQLIILESRRQASA